MKSIFLKYICLGVALLLLATAFAGCNGESSNPFTQNGFSSITVNKNGEIQATATFNSLILDSREGDMVRLYEVLPGETVPNALKKDPIAERKIGGEVVFRVPLTTEENRTRLYSSFLLCLSDGTLITEVPTYVTLPKSYAVATATPLAPNSPKGLSATDAVGAAGLETGRVMAEVSLSRLMENGDTPISFNGQTLKISSLVLAELDGQIRTATTMGLEASLTLILDTVLPIPNMLPLPHYLANRYDGEEGQGVLSALYLDDGGSLTAEFSATLLRFSRTAMLSRIESSRVYLLSSRTDLNDITAYFSTVSALLAAEGGLDWGAALRMPSLGTAPWSSTATDRVTVPGLSQLRATLLSSNGGKGAPVRLALCGVTLPTEDEAAAVSAAYFYRVAASAGFSSIFFAQNPNPDTLTARVLTMAERGFSDDVEQLCARRIGSAWTDMPPHRTTGKLLVGAATTDTGGLRYDAWLDFSKGSTLDFAAINGIQAPTLQESATFGTSVLYTWLASPYAGAETGVIRVMDSAEDLRGVSSLSVQALPQLSGDDSCLLTLRLRGYSPSGTPITYESGVEIHSGTWQTVTFSIASFVAEADLSAPCTISLVTDSAPAPDDGEGASPYVLWIKEIGVRRPKGSSAVLTAVLLSLLGLLIGFAVTILLFRKRIFRRKGSKTSPAAKGGDLS